MANFISKLLRREDTTVKQDLKNNLMFEAGRAQLFEGPDEGERAEKKDLGIKEAVLHDDDADIVLAQKCIKFEYVPEVDEKGKLVYLTDGTGKPALTEDGTPILRYKQVVGINNQFAALQRMLSPVNRCVFLDPKNKELVLLMMEDIVEDIKMGVPESEFDLGVGSYLDSLQSSLVMLADDATNGAKVKSLLEIRKIQTLDILNQKEKKGLM